MASVETIKINDNIDFHVWEDDDGWYSCRSGYANGLYSESDDIGPYDNRAAALKAQEIDWDAFNDAN